VAVRLRAVACLIHVAGSHTMESTNMKVGFNQLRNLQLRRTTTNQAQVPFASALILKWGPDWKSSHGQ